MLVGSLLPRHRRAALVRQPDRLEGGRICSLGVAYRAIPAGLPVLSFNLKTLQARRHGLFTSPADPGVADPTAWTKRAPGVTLASTSTGACATRTERDRDSALAKL